MTPASTRIRNPVEPERLVQVVADTARSRQRTSRTPQPRWPREPIRSKFESVLARRGVHEALEDYLEQPDGAPFYRHLSLRRGHPLADGTSSSTEAPSCSPTGRAPMETTYCAIVRAYREPPFTTDDTRRDDGSVNARDATAVRSYCGVSLRRPDGTALGPLCHFDVVACDVPGPEVALMEAAADRIMPMVQHDLRGPARREL